MIRASLRRPVAIAMGYFSVALLGVAAFRNIPIELFPDTRLPRLTVNASWPGTSPETMEAFVTSPIEAAIQLVPGTEKVVSVSSEGNASISVFFARDTDMDFARLYLSERMSALEENELPPGLTRIAVRPYVPPEVARQQVPFLSYTFTGVHTLEFLRYYLGDQVVPELQRIEGVALVEVQGGQDRLLEVVLDKRLMAAFNLNPYAVSQRLTDLDLVQEAGSVRSGDNEWTVTIQNRAASAQDIRSAILTTSEDRLVRVSDVAAVHDTHEEPRSHYRVDGRPAVGLELRKEIGANTVRVADAVKERLAQLEDAFPPNTRLLLDSDESEQIRRQLTDLRTRALASVAVILCVLLLFLRSLRSSLVVFATIAFSVLIALNLIYWLGLSLNLFTLMGLAMGFGLIVDNSIVVLENIYRRWQRGRSSTAAVREGASHVVLPVMAATATTLIVFAPFVYMQDELRIYYLPMAAVVAMTLIASLAVAFSLIPALARKLLPRRADGGSEAWSPGRSRPPFYERFYHALVTRSLRWPWVVVAVGALLLAGTGYLFDKNVTRGVTWGGRWGGQQTYVSINITLPRGSDLERVDELTGYFEDRLAMMPEVRNFVSSVGGTSSSTTVRFHEELEHTNVPVMIKDQLYAFSLGFTGADVRVYGFGPSFYGGSGGAPQFRVQILGYNYEKVRDIAEDMGRRLATLPRVRDVNTNAQAGFRQRERISEFGVSVRRDLAAFQNMPVDALSRQVMAAVRGNAGRNTLKLGGDEVNYAVKLEGSHDTDVHELVETLILNADGVPVRLGDLVDVKSQEVLAQIRREDQQYERTVGYEFRGSYKFGDLTTQAIVDATEVPPGYEVKRSDSFGVTSREKNQMRLVLIVSIVLVYMVTAALFESFLLPLCVLLAVPMALIGVFALFLFLDTPFTREASIGVIMMGGIVVNNSILLVHHVNRIRVDRNLGLRDAVVEGTVERVRPILMTATTTITGMLPLVLFSDSTNSNVWNALAYTLIGGLLSSTLLVLTATPSLYYLFERRRARAPA